MFCSACFLFPWKVAQCGDPLLIFYVRDETKTNVEIVLQKNQLLELSQSTFVATQILM